MTVGQLTKTLSTLLNVDQYKDFSDNGLQVGDAGATVKKVAFAVDACLESFEKAAAEESDFLFVHHGLFWGKAEMISGITYRRIKALLDKKIALFACHLPLDANSELGNNAQMAKALGLQDCTSFSPCMGNDIGWYGRLEKPMTNSEIVEKLGVRTDGHNMVFNFGKKENTTVGIISGSAAKDVSDAIALGLDCFITGEDSHQTYHLCKEEKINMMCLGHYETEVFGVRAVQKWVEENLGLETVFIDIPTHL